MKLLIIEDDMGLASTIADGLKEDYALNISNSGIDGEFQAQTGQYDLIILDLMLPDKDGYSICRGLRKSGINTPILVLSGEVDLKTKVKLLDSGADDYLTKPFKFLELQARIKALIRRKGNWLQQNLISTHDLILDMDKKTAKRGKQIMPLRRKEYYLLEYLIRNAGKVLSRSMIIDNVWEDEPEMITNVVDVHIKYLRDLIDKPFSKKLIKTVYGLGYKIEA